LAQPSPTQRIFPMHQALPMAIAVLTLLSLYLLPTLPARSTKRVDWAMAIIPMQLKRTIIPSRKPRPRTMSQSKLKPNPTKRRPPQSKNPAPLRNLHRTSSLVFKYIIVVDVVCLHILQPASHSATGLAPVRLPSNGIVTLIPNGISYP
jgi:hypothetical protein